MLALAGALVVGVGLLLFIRTADDETATPWFDCPPDPGAELEEHAVDLVAVSDLPDLTSTAVDPSGGLWSVGKVGVVHSSVEEDPSRALDLRSEVIDEAYEQGMFDIAFHADGTHAYLSFTRNDGALVVAEFEVAGAELDQSSRRDLLTIEQPTTDHNGGGLVVDAAGLLWISVGDGGEGPESDGISVEDYAHQRSQDLSVLHGKLLRIDPREPQGDLPYSIPSDNPFLDREDARPEIWSYGLRNPWRFTVDEVTGDLWIGDVGQFCTEEVDHAPGSSGAGRGANFGWPSYEADRAFLVDEFGDIENHVPPVITLEHESGACSVAGGVVYRGDEFENRRGDYTFIDSCDDTLRFASRTADGEWTVRTATLPISQVVDLELDADGEIVLTSLVDGVHRVVARDP